MWLQYRPIYLLTLCIIYLYICFKCRTTMKTSCMLFVLSSIHRVSNFSSWFFIVFKVIITDKYLFHWSFIEIEKLSCSKVMFFRNSIVFFLIGLQKRFLKHPLYTFVWRNNCRITRRLYVSVLHAGRFRSLPREEYPWDG